MIEKLKKHLKETPIEELKKEWKEVEEWGNIGPSVKEYIERIETMKNKKIILTIGIPASGKSTWRTKFLRDNNNYVCVSRDDFRYMLRNEPFLDPKGEKFVTEMVEQAIIRAVKNKYNVIVDQTNVNIKYLKKLVEFCEKLADVEFKIFDIPLQTAMERDKNRERSVGDEVLKRMHKNYLDLFQCNFDFAPRKKKPYIAQNIRWKRTAGKQPAVIFDIDGTIAHMQGKRGGYDWNKVDVDAVDEKMRETVMAYWKAGYKIIFVTGRDGASKNLTSIWLNNNNIKYDYLFTREEDDYRKSVVAKTEIYNNEIKNNFDVLCAYDDRESDTAMWRNLGIKCYQVAEGIF